VQRRRASLWIKTAPSALLAASAVVALTACGSSSTPPASSTSAAKSSAATSGAAGASGAAADWQPPNIEVPDGDEVGVSLITKNANNPFFIALNDSAKETAAKYNVKLTLSSGKADGDEDSQIQAVEQAIARGDKGILITTNGPGVNPALKKAKDAGLVIIALDTPLEPSSLADMTFASNNFTAGTLIGKWAAAQMDGQKATIAMLDLFNDKIISLDHQRDQGFLTGMGIDTKDDQKNGDEDSTGTYTSGKGGEYEIVCNEPTSGSNDGGKTAMEACIAKNPDINLIYSLNEPAGQGGSEALTAATGNKAVVVSVDGGCGGVAQISKGVINATALQYPSRMAEYGVETVAALARGGKAPAFTPGLDYFDTGLTLVADKPVEGLPSITSAEAESVCWGS
jgi:fructose transport system substrate-binding protein